MAPKKTNGAETPEPRLLQGFSVEILVHIFGCLDIKYALRLARASKYLRGLYLENEIYILLPILSRDFSPLDGLLRTPDASPEVLTNPLSAWHNRPIKFAGVIISTGDKHGHLPELRFQRENLGKVMEVVKAVSQWERAFPRLRFANLVEERRLLRPHEKGRLRRALYVFWRFANSYHGKQDDYDLSLMRYSESVSEVPRNSLRALSTTQLYELRDFWETVYEAVRTKVCPSVSLLRENEGALISDADLALRGWGDSYRNLIQVKKVMRLRPDRLLGLLNFVADYPTANKKVVMRLIRSCHPAFDGLGAFLPFNLDGVIDERKKGFGEDRSPGSICDMLETHVFPCPFGGILDDDAPQEMFRIELDNDGRERLPEDDNIGDYVGRPL